MAAYKSQLYVHVTQSITIIADRYSVHVLTPIGHNKYAVQTRT